MTKIFHLVAALMLLATAANAQRTWTGGATLVADRIKWGDLNNWNPKSVPGPTQDVTIPSGLTYYPTLNTTTGSCRKLTITGGNLTIPGGRTLTVANTAAASTSVSNAGTLTIDGTMIVNLATGSSNTSVSNTGTLALTGTLQVRSNVVNNGIMNFSSGTSGLLLFDNTTSGNTFSGTGTTALYDVTFANGGTTFSPSNTVDIARRAWVASGTVTTGGKIRFVSSATTTTTSPCGYVHLSDPTVGLLSGNITVQRAIATAYNTGAGHRHFSTPVTGPTAASLNCTGYSAVVTPTYSYPTITTPAPNFAYYDESRVPARGAGTSFYAFQHGWACPANTSYSLNNGQGYMVTIPASSIPSLTGTPNTGTYSTALLDSGPNADSGWHLVGNPYPTPINVVDVLITNVQDTDPLSSSYNPDGFDGTAYFFHSFDTYYGGYSSIDVNGATAGTDPLTELFPVMQGFFVHKPVSANAQAFVFTDDHRADPLNARYSSASLTAFYRSAPTSVATPWLYRLVATDTETKRSDNAAVCFRADATPGHDVRYDAVRPGDNVGMPTLFTANVAGEECMANYLPLLRGSLTLPVGLRTLMPGRTYTLGAPAKQTLPAGTRVWLEDRVAGKSVELSAGRPYKFLATTAAYEHRFFLRFEPAATAVQAPTERLEVAVYPNPAPTGNALQISANKVEGVTATATLLNSFGQVLSTRQVPVRNGLLNDEMLTNGLKAGVYLLRVATDAGTTTRRIEIR